MSNTQRLILVGITGIAAIAAFVIVNPAGDDDEATPPATTAARTAPAQTQPAETEPAETTPTETPPSQRKPEATRIRIRDGKPVGGVKEIKVEKGDRVRLLVSSSDTASEVHVHGYDLKNDLKPGRSVSFSFPADVEGVFEIELEETATRIAELTVEPR